MSERASRTYLLGGMTCAHCVAAVRAELGAIPGVSEVEVDLDSGRVTIDGEEVSDEQVRAAVEEAGYTLVG